MALVCRSEDNFGNWFSPRTVCIPGVGLRASGPKAHVYLLSRLPLFLFSTLFHTRSHMSHMHAQVLSAEPHPRQESLYLTVILLNKRVWSISIDVLKQI